MRSPNENGSRRAIEDGALIKGRTLAARLASIFFYIPTPGVGIAVRETTDGPVWDLATNATLRPFTVNPVTRKMAFGVVGGRIPTYGGVAIGSASTPAFPAGTYTIYLKMTFGVSFDGAGALIAWPLNSVTVETSTSGDTASVKHLPCGSCSGGVFSNSAFSGSLSVSLCNNAASQTTLIYNAA